jgi:hypothetical protein
MSTFLYTGNGSTQTITNGIDLAGKGGLVWIKSRNVSESNVLYDTARGVNQQLQSNNTDASSNSSNTLTAFNSNGFTLGTNRTDPSVNYVSWTFRKQPKFFDVVTFTAPSSGVITINHNLGSVPGCVILKRTDADQFWVVNHRSIDNTKYLVLNSTASETSASPLAVTYGATTVTYSAGYLTPNAQYVAYLFAHNAGGFGLTGTDNVISCGSYTVDSVGTKVTVDVGYEPQWLLIKRATGGTGAWCLFDNMRGIATSGDDAMLQAQSTGSEAALGGVNAINLTSTGFETGTDGTVKQASSDYIYIAIRRGPMKVPTTGTSVFSPNARTGNGSTQTVSGLSFSPDLWMTKNRGNTQNNWAFDRLRGPNQPLSSNLTDDEATNTSNFFGGTPIFTPTNTGFTTIGQGQVNTSSGAYIDWLFGRAPGFFDEVCYTGTRADMTPDTPQVLNHNLGIAPQLAIAKKRNNSGTWWVNSTLLTSPNYYVALNSDAAAADGGVALIGSPTATTISVKNAANALGDTYVAYLFASCPGVQYINSYVGDGTTGRTINCGFTGGARFVCIKATSTTGSWWTFDSARGIVTNNDPALQLNSTAAEVTSADAIDTASSGFIVNQESTCSLNASGVSYLVWAIA